ncbi:hypothetical protein GCM10010402_16100 [Actinomadura luteofluorescens]
MGPSGYKKRALQTDAGPSRADHGVHAQPPQIPGEDEACQAQGPGDVQFVLRRTGLSQGKGETVIPGALQYEVEVLGRTGRLVIGVEVEVGKCSGSFGKAVEAAVYAN